MFMLYNVGLPLSNLLYICLVNGQLSSDADIYNLLFLNLNFPISRTEKFYLEHICR